MTDFIKTISALAEINATSFIQQTVVYLLWKEGPMSLSEIQAHCPSITIYRATLDVLIQKGIVKKARPPSPLSTVKFYLCGDLRLELNEKA
jgi:hypothetical protein